MIFSMGDAVETVQRNQKAKERGPSLGRLQEGPLGKVKGLQKEAGEFPIEKRNPKLQNTKRGQRGPRPEGRSIPERKEKGS